MGWDYWGFCSLAWDLNAASFTGSDGCLRGGSASWEGLWRHLLQPLPSFQSPGWPTPQFKTSGMSASLRLCLGGSLEVPSTWAGLLVFSWLLVGYSSASRPAWGKKMCPLPGCLALQPHHPVLQQKSPMAPSSKYQDLGTCSSKTSFCQGISGIKELVESFPFLPLHHFVFVCLFGGHSSICERFDYLHDIMILSLG